MMNQDKQALPERWVETVLKNVCQKITDGTHHSPSKEAQTCKGDHLYITAKNIKESGVDLSDVTYVPESIHRPIYERCNPQKGDVLYIKDGATTGIATVNQLDEEFSLLSSVALLKPHCKVLNAWFLKWFLNSPTGFRAMTSLMGGTAIKRLTIQKIKEGALPIAPLNEQRRIVSKIEELFSDLDEGEAALKRAQKLISTYRQSVLKAAFEGNLTADWREDNNNKLETTDEILARVKKEGEIIYEEQLEEWKVSVEAWEENGKDGKKPARPSKPEDIMPLQKNDILKLAPLPYGWTWLRVKDLCDVVRGGSPRPAGDPRYYDGDIPFLKVADLTRTSGAYLNTFSYTIKKSGLQKTRKVSANTLLLSNSGATLGVPKICLMEATFNDGVAAFIGLDKNYLLYHLYFWNTKTEELRSINQGAAQPNLNTNLIKEIFIPICSGEEMIEVTNRIEEKLSICDQISEEIESNLKKAGALRQAILKDAFSGKLVPQDHTDESASILLERIKAERDTQAKAAPKRTRGHRKQAKQLELI